MEGATTLPGDLVSAASLLFEMGMADPRGCEYREVRVTTGDVWNGDGGVAKVHGWVLPQQANDPQRYAVLWNGLVYPAVEVGGKADVAADVTAVCQADEAMRITFAKDNPGQVFSRWGRANDEKSMIFEKTLLPVKVCLLLRLGEMALAEKFWGTCMVGASRHYADQPDDPFLVLMEDWLWARYDRAITAHMRGDDQLSVLDSQALVGMQKAGLEAAAKRGLTPKRDLESRFLDFLDPAGSGSPDALRADGQRRLQEKNRTHVLTVGVEKYPDQSKRIAALIDDLDQVNARQMGQPGGVALGEDRVVRALIAEGEAAVQPLLTCLEKDARLTRSVHFWRDFAKYRSFTKVYEAAYVALSGILKQSFFTPAATGDDLSQREAAQRQALAGAIRAYWEKNKGVKQEERWYATLADDSATDNEWLQAAELITRPADVEVTPSSMFGGGWVMTPARKPGQKIALRGEALRSKSAPNVGDLLAQRLKALCGGQDDSYSRRLRSAQTLAEALIAWDGKAHLDDLRQYTEALIARYGAQKQGREYLGELIASICGKRMDLDDERAYAEYIQWIQGTDPQEMSFGVRTIFDPIWRHAGRPDMTALAEKLFNGEGSPWNPLFRTDKRGSGNYQMNDLLTTPLVSLPAIRKQLLRQLEDQGRAGTVKVTSGGGLSISGDGGWQTGTSLKEVEDPLAPEAGKSLEFRVCDYVAWQLVRIDGFPRFELYWPQAKRDETIKQVRAVMAQYGPRLALIAQSGRPSGAGFSFAPLDHPATADDAARGLALFSLEGERRVWKLPETPLRATCPSLRTMPSQQNAYDPDTKTSKRYTYWWQEGLIWQAEEVQRDGKWERWFGFVGPGFMGKLPASDVVLHPVESWLWGSADKGVEWRLDAPDGPMMMRPGSMAMVVLKAGGPVALKLRVRNVLGVAQEVTEEWVRPGALAEGVTLHVQRLEDEAALAWYAQANQKNGWADVALRGVASNSPGKKRMLDVLAELPVQTLDLKTWGVETQGIYRVWLEKEKSYMQPQIVRLADQP
jgi:hypothetical protein